MPDRDKVIAGLEFCLAHDFCWSMKYKCPWVDECRKDYKSLKRAAIELLKEQEEIVRCGDCKHGHLVGSGFFECKKNIKAHYADWFCADGERR